MHRLRRAGVALAAGSLAAALFPAGTASGSSPTDIQLLSSASVVTWSDAIRFHGVVSSPAGPECIQNVEVVLQMDAIDDGEMWLEVARARTDDDGSFSADVLAEQSAIYSAYTVPEEGSAACEAAGSQAVEVMARFKVTLERSALAVPKDRSVRLTVRVEPTCPNDRNGGPTNVPLLQLQGGRFDRVDAKRDHDYDCTVTFKRRITRTSVFMSKVGRQGGNSVFLGGRSAEVGVGVRR